MTTLLLNLEPALKEDLKREAQQKGVSVSQLVRTILKQGLQKNQKPRSFNPFAKVKGKLKAKDIDIEGDKTNISSRIDEILYGPSSS